MCRGQVENFTARSNVPFILKSDGQLHIENPPTLSSPDMKKSSHCPAWNFSPASYIVTAVGPTKNSETINRSVNETFEKLDEVIDLTLVLDKLPESLIVLKHLLCLDYRDIVYIDTDNGADGFPPS